MTKYDSPFISADEALADLRDAIDDKQKHINHQSRMKNQQKAKKARKNRKK